MPRTLRLVLVAAALLVPTLAWAQNGNAPAAPGTSQPTMQQLRREALRLTLIDRLPTADRQTATKLLDRAESLRKRADALRRQELEAYVTALKAGTAPTAARAEARQKVAAERTALAKDVAALRSDVRSFVQKVPQARALLRAFRTGAGPRAQRAVPGLGLRRSGPGSYRPYGYGQYGSRPYGYRPYGYGRGMRAPDMEGPATRGPRGGRPFRYGPGAQRPGMQAPGGYGPGFTGPPMGRSMGRPWMWRDGGPASGRSWEDMRLGVPGMGAGCWAAPGPWMGSGGSWRWPATPGRAPRAAPQTAPQSAPQNSAPQNSTPQNSTPPSSGGGA